MIKNVVQIGILCLTTWVLAGCIVSGNFSTDRSDNDLEPKRKKEFNEYCLHNRNNAKVASVGSARAMLNRIDDEVKNIGGSATNFAQLKQQESRYNFNNCS